jgi:hypothetical protein
MTGTFADKIVLTSLLSRCPRYEFQFSFPSICSPESSLDSELMDIVVQNIADFSTPHLTFRPLKSIIHRKSHSDSVHYYGQDFQRDLRKSFISFEPATEHPSSHELFIRAGPHPFSPCGCYVDYFVPQRFEPSSQSFHASKRVFDRIIPEECPEPAPPASSSDCLPRYKGRLMSRCTCLC